MSVQWSDAPTFDDVLRTGSDEEKREARNFAEKFEADGFLAVQFDLSADKARLLHWTTTRMHWEQMERDPKPFCDTDEKRREVLCGILCGANQELASIGAPLLTVREIVEYPYSLIDYAERGKAAAATDVAPKGDSR